MFIKVPTIDVQKATLQTIDIGQVKIGPIAVDKLVVNNAAFAITGAQAVLSNMSVTISVQVSVEWRIHIGLPDWIPDIDEGDTYNLGSVGFGPINIGNVTIPGLSNINLNIPNVTAQNMSVTANPVALQMKNATAEQIQATNLTLPSAGFTLAGLAVGSVQASGLKVPAAQLDQAKIARVKGDAVKIPAFTLTNLKLPGVQVPAVSSAAFDVPAVLPTRSLGFDAGILRLFVHLTPSAHSHIGSLQISNATANATIAQVVLHDVTLPYDVLNLTLSQVGIGSISIPSVNVS